MSLYTNMMPRKLQLLNPELPWRGADAANGDSTSRAKEWPAFSSPDFPQMTLKLASPEAVKKPLQPCLVGQDIDFWTVCCPSAKWWDAAPSYSWVDYKVGNCPWCCNTVVELHLLLPLQSSDCNCIYIQLQAIGHSRGLHSGDTQLWSLLALQ